MCRSTSNPGNFSPCSAPRIVHLGEHQHRDIAVQLTGDLAGFDQPDEGELYLDGQPLADIPPERRPVHTVFQSYALFPHLTVSGNIAFPLEMAGRSRDEIRRRTGEALALVHLEDKGDAFPHELSGGQKQRVALARGLVNKPRLLLLDGGSGPVAPDCRHERRAHRTT